MVAIVSGNSLGLSLSSLEILGQEGGRGTAVTGRNGERAFVNIATGNLVLQGQDDYLASYGTDISVLRTYNSRGELTGGATSTWALGTTRQKVEYAAGANTMARTDRDDAKAVYTWDSLRSLYVTTDGAGAHDTIVRNGDGSSVWTDGATGLREFYDANGRLTASQDTNGNQLTYHYDTSGRLASVSSASGDSGDSVAYTWDANGRLSAVTDLLDGASVSQVQYGYDDLGRLASTTQAAGLQMQAYTSTQDPVTGYLTGTVADGMQALTETYEYDELGRRVRTRSADGVDTRVAYDAAGLLTKIEDLSRSDSTKQITQYAYDAAGNRIHEKTSIVWTTNGDEADVMQDRSS